MPDKAREAFRTISEVANWLDIPAHVLRFWESKFTQIKPVKRAGGRRYYRPADMELIGGIKTLLHDNGLTIRGVQKMIKDEGVKAVSALSPPITNISDDEADARRAARRARRAERLAARKSAQIEDAELADTASASDEDAAQTDDANQPAPAEELVRDEAYSQEEAEETPTAETDEAEEAEEAENDAALQSRNAKRQASMDEEAALIEEEALLERADKSGAPAGLEENQASDDEPVEKIEEPSGDQGEDQTEPAPDAAPETAPEDPQPAPPPPVSTDLESVTLSPQQTAKLEAVLALYDAGLQTALEDKPARADLQELHDRLAALRDRMAQETGTS